MSELRQPRAPLKLLTCEAARPLASRVASILGRPLVKSNEMWFACGEGKFIIEDNVRGDDLYIFQAGELSRQVKGNRLSCLVTRFMGRQHWYLATQILRPAL